MEDRLHELWAHLNLRKAQEAAWHNYFVRAAVYAEDERQLAQMEAWIEEQEQRWEERKASRASRRAIDRMRELADELRAARRRRRRREELIEQMIRNGNFLALMFVL
ncbi:hypothetical protein [Roseovarius indicus]|uniref:hypothetical protein n=1 Tax=Roseovarius indicus TaxID=540747 RepID=UPI004059E089